MGYLLIQGWRRSGLLCMLATGLVVVALPGVALAAEAHVFDPGLSLTGGCEISSADEILDPGLCPMPPGVPGVDHPSASFRSPRSVATDSYGDIFVASYGQAESGSEGRIDIFDSSGFFISEFAVPMGPRSTAVDSKGNLYVTNKENELFVYPPVLYEPQTGEIEYGGSPTLVTSKKSLYVGVAVNPQNDHVFISYGHGVAEYSSKAEGNEFIEVIGEGTLFAPYGVGLAIDASRGRIYASDLAHSGEFPDPAAVRIFELASPHALIGTVDGSTTPSGKFFSFLSLAVEESTGNLFVYDGGEGAEVIYELAVTEDPEGNLEEEYLATIDRGLQGHYTSGAEIAVDNGENSPNGALNPFGTSYLYVPAYPSKTGHSFAFGPLKECAPKVEESSFSGVTETEAKLQAQVNPCYLDTTYTFEYTTQQSWEAEEFAGATVAEEGEIPVGGSPVSVSAALEGLEPGTAYRFRILATNKKGPAEAEGEFATYPETGAPPCPNEAFRTGLAALLPDCRAYELVTPPDTNARVPVGVEHIGTFFATRETSPAGDKVSFGIEGGALPGAEATGSYAGDPYLATRTAEGWSTSYAGPSGAEVTALLPGSNSPDQGYSLWSTGSVEGSAVIEGKETNYVRYPDGHSALVGRGSLAADPRAEGSLISENGGHIVFSSGVRSFPAVQLEPDAPPSGTRAIYDRTIDPETGEEETHVVSLLPGNVTPAAGQNALYQGASLDGRGVAFSIGKKLYLRFDDEETYEAGEDVTFAGVAEGGTRIFYLKSGNLFALDVNEPEPIQFTKSGDVTPINIAAEGRVAYFVSPGVLSGEPNPSGDKPVKGEENLYRSEEGLIAFIGTVTERDVKGEGEKDGLGLWLRAVGSSGGAPGKFGLDPSRTTPDGSVLLFESRGRLVSYDPGEEHAEVYRYDATAGELTCLSCNPTLAPATGQASLESVSLFKGEEDPFGFYAYVNNLRDDGRRVFFQSTEPLVADDVDGLQDVYEWEAQGVGTCEREGGCVYLISSGESSRTDYLYAVSDSGEDAFFRSSDLLLSADSDETPSIYDARVGGGFPATEGAEDCQGEGCRPILTSPPVLPGPVTRSAGPSGNVKLQCPKGMHKVKRNGKTRCVKKHHKHHHRKAGPKKKGAGK